MDGRKEMILALLVAVLLLTSINAYVKAAEPQYTLIVSTRPNNVILPEETIHGIKTFESCRDARLLKLTFRSETIWVTCSPEELE